jgi:hypothetical protein
VETPARAIIRFDCNVARWREDLGREKPKARAIGRNLPRMSKKIAFLR